MRIDLGWLTVALIVGVIGYGLGYWQGWWKGHRLGLVVEKDLSRRLARAEEQVHELRCEMSGMDAATEVFEELMFPDESKEDAEND